MKRTFISKFCCNALIVYNSVRNMILGAFKVKYFNKKIKKIKLNSLETIKKHAAVVVSLRMLTPNLHCLVNYLYCITGSWLTGAGNIYKHRM